MDKLNLSSSASMEISKKAKELKNKGIDVVSLSIGDTHFSISKFLSKKINEACQLNITHYDNANGLKRLRQKIALNYSCSENEVVISNGVKNSLFNYLYTKTNKKILILEPAWLGYEGIAKMLNMPFSQINMYSKNWLKKVKSESFDFVLVCSPNNPDGNVLSKKEILELYKISSKKNAVIILDEIYKDFIYEGKHNFEVLYRKKDVVILNGFSKSHAVTGLRIGFSIIKDKNEIDLMNKVQQNSFTCSNTISQYALSFAKQNKKAVKKHSKYYKKNRDIIAKEIPELKNYKPDAGFYYFFPLKAIGISDSGEKFCTCLLDKKAVALIPGNAYGKGFENYVRMSFCVDRKELIKGIKRIKEYIIENGNN